MRHSTIKWIVLFVLPLLIGLAGAANSLDWISMGSSPARGGYGEAVLGTGDALYIVRCMSAGTRPAFYRFNPRDRSWFEESVAGLPDGAFRNGTSLAWDRERFIYALAGARYADEDRRNVYRFDTHSSTWSEAPSTAHAQGAGNALSWSGFDQSLYAFIGSRSHSGGSSIFARFDPDTDTWVTLTSPWETTDDGASLVWTGDRVLYALRGEVVEESPRREFARYDIVLDRWEAMADFPGEGGVGDGGSLLWIGEWLETERDTIYALSGGAADEAPGYQIYAYSISENAWTLCADLPCPVGYYVGNRLGYAAGSLFYWQGTPGSDAWVCGGDVLYAASLIPSAAAAPPCEACLASLNQARAEDFDAIDGIGASKADALVSAQPFAASTCEAPAILDMLDQVQGIGSTLSDRILRSFCPELATEP